MENSEDIIEKAINLLYPFYNREQITTDDVYYVTENSCPADTEGDYCSECIDDAVKEYRKYYLLDQRKKPIKSKNYPDNEVRHTYCYRAWRDNEFSKFEYLYESDRQDNNFRFCTTCGKRLEICFDLSETEFEHWKTASIEKSDSYGYELYEVLNCCKDGEYDFFSNYSSNIKTQRKQKLKRIQFGLDAIDLAKRVIDIFEEREV